MKNLVVESCIRSFGNWVRDRTIKARLRFLQIEAEVWKQENKFIFESFYCTAWKQVI